MAKIDLYRNLEAVCSHTEEVGAGLEREARRIASIAQADLNDKIAHPHSRGFSYITMAHGHLDRYVVLADTDQNDGSGPAAWVIEKRATHILYKAAGLA